MIKKQEIESRIAQTKSDLKYYADMLINGDSIIWQDEAIRQIDFNVKRLASLEYLLSVYDEVVK